jgi:hypothetical protein
LTLADVKSVTVTVTGGITNPLTVPLVGNSSVPPTQYSALISDLPIGCNYVFTASAYAPTARPCSQGAVSGQTITKNQTANIVIDMNQRAPAVGIYDEAPVIDGLTSTASCVSKNDTVVIKASAHDPDLGDTAHMIWAWTVDNTCGTLSTPPVNVAGSDNGLPIPPATTPATVYTDGTSTVTFTATSSSASCQVNLSIADARQPAVLMTTGSVTISIGDSCAFGNAKITAIPNTCPVVANVTASVVPVQNTPSYVPMVVGQSTFVSVSATDADGDTLLYSWSSPDCAGGTPTTTYGNWNDSTAKAGTWFLLTSAPPSGTCTFLVHVSDGTFADGKAKCDIVNHLSLPVKGAGDVVQGNPVFGFDYMSTNTVNDGDSVKLEIVAPNTGCPAPGYTLTWNPAGTALTTLDPPFTTGITLTAAAGAGANGETVTVTATCPSSGVQTVHSFALIGKTAVCNGAADGTDCTSTAQLTDKCVTAAKCATGQCVAQTSVTCPASTVACQDNVCGHTTDGQCHLQNSSDGTGCSDGLACTTGDKCAVVGTVSVCGGTAVSCTPTGNPCMVNACTEPNGSCVAAAAPNGTICDDHNGCTGASNGTVDTCTAGTCGGPAVVCSPSNYVCTSLTDTTHSCAGAICMSPSFSRSTNTTAPVVGMALGTDGNPWVMGTLFASFPLNLGSGVVTSTGGADIYLAKLDSTGTATQTLTFGETGTGANDQLPAGVAVASQGNIGVIGVYTAEIDFDLINGPTTLGVDYVTTSTAGTAFYAVLDSTGTPLKAHNVDVGGGAIAAIGSNPSQSAFVICGQADKVVTQNTGNPNPGGAAKNALGLLTTPSSWVTGNGMDIVVAKINGDGTVAWGKQIGGAGNQLCESATIDGNGDVIIAGKYDGTLNFGAGALPAPAAGAGFIYVAKLHGSAGTGYAAGDLMVAKGWGTAGRSDANAVTVDGNNNILLAGSISGAVDFGNDSNSVDVSIPYLGLTDAYVAKFTTALVPVWAKAYGDAAHDQSANGVAADSNGNVIFGGTYSGSLGALGLSSASATSPDGFAAELSSDGKTLDCAQTYGDAAGTQGVLTLAVSRTTNKAFLAGSFSSSIQFSPLATMTTPGAGTAYGYIAGLTTP